MLIKWSVWTKQLILSILYIRTVSTGSQSAAPWRVIALPSFAWLGPGLGLGPSWIRLCHLARIMALLVRTMYVPRLNGPPVKHCVLYLEIWPSLLKLCPLVGIVTIFMRGTSYWAAVHAVKPVVECDRMWNSVIRITKVTSTWWHYINYAFIHMPAFCRFGEAVLACVSDKTPITISYVAYQLIFSIGKRCQGLQLRHFVPWAKCWSLT